PLVPGGRLELDHLRFNLVDHLEVEGVRLLDPAGAPVVGLERLSVDYDLREILDSKVTIHHLDVQAPTANLSADDQGGLNVLTVLGVEPMPDTDGIPFPCRDYAVSELFDEGDLGPVLDIVNVEARNIRVEVACNSGQVSGFDLSTDPAAVDRGPGQDLPDGLSLMNSLAAEVEAAKAAFPEVSCVWP
ncbi:MAG TPA: hypothetical protein PKY30_15540, partial [Myxococcota bacterium]|nr:hypothetical protein [Myxococcota bacterium]